jgi:hypothetical protein
VRRASSPAKLRLQLRDRPPSTIASPVGRPAAR